MDEDGNVKGVSNARDLDNISFEIMYEALDYKPERAKERRCLKCSKSMVSVQRICPPCKRQSEVYYGNS